MFTYDFIILLSGLALAATSVYLFSTAIFTNNADAQALAWATGTEPAKSKSPLINLSRPLIHNFTLQHAQRIKNKSYRARIERRLLTAGLSNELNVDEYIGLQILWGVMFPLFMLIMNFALQLEMPLPACIMLGFFGFFYPNFYCNQQRAQRYTAVVLDLPFFIDLMALSTQAGSDFMGAIKQIVDKSEGGVLAEEFRKVLSDIDLGSSRREALKRLADRLDIPEITSFAAVVRDADETGASIAKVLKDQAVQMRLERFVRAEKAGARASQLILLPMVFLILPAIFIVVFAPVALQFMYGSN